jgi:hypothetical protein
MIASKNNTHVIESTRAFCLRFCVTVLTVAVAYPGTLMALPNVPEQPGWSGFFVFGAGYTDIESNTVAGNRLIDGGKDTINNILQSPESSDDIHAVVSGEVNYTLGNRNQIFFGTTLEDAVTLDGAIQLGWRKQTDRPGIFQVGILFAAIPTEVWEDPYLTGVARSDTNRDSTGLRFQWDRIFGSDLELQISYRDIDVDTERSGQTACATPIPPAITPAQCQTLLRRNGGFYATDLGWWFRFEGGNHILRPLIGYRTFDADGAAESYDSARVELTYSYLGEKYSLVTNAAVASKEFDRPNPLYGIKRDSDNIALSATLFYKLPTASKRWQLFTTVLWGDSDSDIDFHDNELFTISAGVFYRFGNLPPARQSDASLELQTLQQSVTALR